MNWYKIAQISQLEEKLENVQGIPAITHMLNQYGLQYYTIQFPEDTIIKTNVNGTDLIIPDPSFPSLEEPLQWIYNLSDNDLYSYIPPNDYNIDFWKDNNISTLYHGTDSININTIMQEGLNPSNKTRGINNKSTPSAIFTTTEMDTLGSYGDTLIEINVHQMRLDGFNHTVSLETPIEEAQTRQQLADKLGIQNTNFVSDYYSEGLFETTVIFYDTIPPKYLKILD